MLAELTDGHPNLSVTEREDGFLGQVLSRAGHDVVPKQFSNTVFVWEDVW